MTNDPYRVSFSEIVVASLETQIHFFLCLGSGGNEMLFDVGPDVQ